MRVGPPRAAVRRGVAGEDLAVVAQRLGRRRSGRRRPRGAPRSACRAGTAPTPGDQARERLAVGRDPRGDPLEDERCARSGRAVARWPLRGRAPADLRAVEQRHAPTSRRCRGSAPAICLAPRPRRRRSGGASASNEIGHRGVPRPRPAAGGARPRSWRLARAARAGRVSGFGAEQRHRLLVQAAVRAQRAASAARSCSAAACPSAVSRSANTTRSPIRSAGSRSARRPRSRADHLLDSRRAPRAVAARVARARTGRRAPSSRSPGRRGGTT